MLAYPITHKVVGKKINEQGNLVVITEFEYLGTIELCQNIAYNKKIELEE